MNLDDDFFEYTEEAGDEDFQDVDFTAEDFIFPDEEKEPPDPNRRRKILIAAGVAAVVLVCCVGFLFVGWHIGDYVVEFLGF